MDSNQEKECPMKIVINYGDTKDIIPVPEYVKSADEALKNFVNVVAKGNSLIIVGEEGSRKAIPVGNIESVTVEA
jgi:hypothetical protein